MNPSTKAPPNARNIALLILNKLHNSDLILDRIMEEILEKNCKLSKQDRALTNAIVYGVLRWQGRIDWIIKHFSKTRISKIEPNILNILRMGVFQILYLNRIPNSAAVNTSVELAKPKAPKWIVGYVNGILRNVVRHHDKVSFPAPKKDPVLALTTSKSFPSWLIKRWLNRFGPERTAAVCDAINITPLITIRTNTLSASLKRCSEALTKEDVMVAPTSYSPFGLSIKNLNKAIPDLEAFKKGMFQVQDEAAQIATCLLNPIPGKTVLDACAGLGGKTAHMAQLMKNRGKIVAMDLNKEKLKRLDAEMNRLGITIVETFVHDLNIPPPKSNIFDSILLDAPCSGLGVLRRNPDTKWSKSKRNLTRFQKRQISFLLSLAPLVKPKGKLVYVVCSFEPEENEDVIKSFLKQRLDFQIDKNPEGLPQNAHILMDENGFLRTFPDRHNMDGFFSTCLRKIHC